MPRVSSKQVNVPNVAPRKIQVDTTNEQVGQEGTVTMEVTGPAKLEHPAIEPVTDLTNFKEKAAILAFMDEIVEVEVHTSTDESEPQFVQLWNDGRSQVIPRGIPTPVKRKYVEVLARLKANKFRNEEFRDPAGNESVRWPKTTGLRYPFNVVTDPNPRGRSWLRGVLAEG